MEFESDKNKAELNIKRHNISFADAEYIFDDLNSVEIFDAIHSQNENRFNRLGLTAKGLLFVVYSVNESENDEIIRIISARKATKKEIEIYNEFNRK